MFKRVVVQGAVAVAALAVALPAKAGMVEEAITAFAQLDANVHQSNEQIEDYEIDAARASLTAAQDEIADYGEVMDAIHDASDNLAGLLGDAWEPALTASANLSARITDTLGRIDNGTADFAGLLAAADASETAFNTARAATQQFRGKFFAFRVVTLADMRTLFDRDIGPRLETVKGNLVARKNDAAQLELALMVHAMEDLVSQANAATSMTTTLGDPAAQAIQNVAPAFAALQRDILALQVVAGHSNPDAALDAVTASEQAADRALNEAVNRMTDLEGKFVLVCDSACR